MGDWNEVGIDDTSVRYEPTNTRPSTPTSSSYSFEPKFGDTSSNAQVTVSDNNVSPIFTVLNDGFTFWPFCPPSNNLWTVDIKLHSNGSTNTTHTLRNLYENIRIALGNFKRNFSTKYSVNIFNNIELERYLANLQKPNTNIFLAQGVNINTNRTNVSESDAGYLQQHGGFITSGKTISSRNNMMSVNIQFLQSNYEISDIIFDQWISALACQGLIQDDTLPELRADIFLYNYAASHPDHLSAGGSYGKKGGALRWVLRKTVTLYKAFPVSRGDLKVTYDPNEAGVYSIDTVNFRFSDYKIDYHL